MKRLYFRRLKRHSSTMNPLDSGWLDLYCGCRPRKTDMATAISNFTSRGGVAEPELQLASLGFWQEALSGEFSETREEDAVPRKPEERNTPGRGENGFARTA